MGLKLCVVVKMYAIRICNDQKYVQRWTGKNRVKFDKKKVNQQIIETASQTEQVEGFLQIEIIRHFFKMKIKEGLKKNSYYNKEKLSIKQRYITRLRERKTQKTNRKTYN